MENRANTPGRRASDPTGGVFTDGACSGNPGPGGWAAVWVENDAVREERHGHEARTTNNRMEMSALIAAYEMIPADLPITIYSDSQLCVKTINEWAASWERRGWRRKTGPVENLDLVQRAYALAKARPKARLEWIKAHDGARWNEYADALATSPLR
ncbi:MAG: ribonuclease HI [Acidobacteria bacterium]|nr:ribonuclease HI [Acidobacteriota bacterium]